MRVGEQSVPRSLRFRETSLALLRMTAYRANDCGGTHHRKQFDVTRERIRQIEAKALRKLRHPSRSEQLRSFLQED